jgi:hypothetical protein
MGGHDSALEYAQSAAHRGLPVIAIPETGGAAEEFTNDTATPITTAEQAKEVVWQVLRELEGRQPRPSGSPLKGPNIYLTYASEDRERARALVGRFKSHGIEVWSYERSFPPGDEASRVIRGAIEDADFAVVLQSTAMHTKEERFFRAEISEALRRQETMSPRIPSRIPFLIPVRIDDSPPLPELGDFQMFDARDPGADERLATMILDHWRPFERDIEDHA